MAKKKLGRGLDALLGTQYSETELKNAPLEDGMPTGEMETTKNVTESGTPNRKAGEDFRVSASNEIEAAIQTDGTRLIRLDPKKLESNPFQPRTIFDEQALQELAVSLKEHGVLQPVVATVTEDGHYVIIAGERRTRASILAGLSEIPVLLTHIDAKQNLELALIENIQRENLNPVEEAQAYKKLLTMYDLSQEELAKKIGKSRPTVANMLRLLQLPPYAIEALEQNKLSSGHARTILSVLTPSDQQTLFDAIMNEGLSVRNAEALAANLNKGLQSQKKHTPTSKTAPKTVPSSLVDMQQRLLEKLGTKVVIRGTEKQGVIEISYFSKDDINSLYEKLFGSAE